jgi:hypothetical protein
MSLPGIGHPANFSLCCVLPDSIPAGQILSMTKPDKLKIRVTNMVTLVCGITQAFLGVQQIWNTIRAWSQFFVFNVELSYAQSLATKERPQCRFYRVGCFFYRFQTPMGGPEIPLFLSSALLQMRPNRQETT